MKRLVCLALLLLLSSPAMADVTIQGSLAPKRVAILTVKESKDAIWDVYPEPEEYQEIGGAVVFAGPPGTVYTVKALVIDFEKKTKERGRVVVKFAGEPVTPPAPPVPPTPGPTPPTPPPPAPTPVDAFTTKILTAYAKEASPNKAALVQAFAKAYREKSTEAKMTTAARFIDFMLLLEAARAAADGGELKEIRTAISTELNNVLPTTVTTPIDQAGRDLLATQMARVAIALEACK